eukprot:scaffold14511_cov110-Alexandrium_tamarense.AAC.2
MTRSQLEEIVKIRRDVVVEVGRWGKWSLSFVSHHQGGGQCLEKQQVTSSCFESSPRRSVHIAMTHPKKIKVSPVPPLN